MAQVIVDARPDCGLRGHRTVRLGKQKFYLAHPGPVADRQNVSQCVGGEIKWFGAYQKSVFFFG